MKSQTCTIRDIAQAAQVSPTTVSRVFAGHDYVSPETRELVLSIAKEHGYTPKQYHRRLNPRRSDVVVGIVVADLHNPFFLQMIDRAEQVLMEQGVNVILCNSDEFLPTGDLQPERTQTPGQWHHHLAGFRNGKV